MARVKTFTNGGSLLPGDLNSIEDDYESAFSTYQTVWTAAGNAGASAPAGVNAIGRVGNPGFGAAVGSALFSVAFYFDPADWTAGTRVTKLRLRAQCVVNAVAPATTFTVGLYPISTYSNVLVNSVGTVVAGSTVAFATPGASSQTQSNSGDFTAPTAGFYLIGCSLGGSPAANSFTGVLVELQRRAV